MVNIRVHITTMFYSGTKYVSYLLDMLRRSDYLGILIILRQSRIISYTAP